MYVPECFSIRVPVLAAARATITHASSIYILQIAANDDPYCQHHCRWLI